MERPEWSVDDWNSVNDTPTADTGIGMFCVDLPTERLALGTVIHFTFRWLDADRWEGTDFEVVVRAE